MERCWKDRARRNSEVAIRIVRLGTPRQPGEGPRLGTVRRPPRGVKKSDHSRLNYYDVWLPVLSPSADLVREALDAADAKGWSRFDRRFSAELRRPDASHLLDALAALSHVADFSLGCYCENEQRCHRSILRRELQKRGAVVA
jgi:uncharacterized protein YeaO (DUF488 family)